MMLVKPTGLHTNIYMGRLVTCLSARAQSNVGNVETENGLK